MISNPFPSPHLTASHPLFARNRFQYEKLVIVIAHKHLRSSRCLAQRCNNDGNQDIDMRFVSTHKIDVISWQHAIKAWNEKLKKITCRAWMFDSLILSSSAHSTVNDGDDVSYIHDVCLETHGNFQWYNWISWKQYAFFFNTFRWGGNWSWLNIDSSC